MNFKKNMLSAFILVLIASATGLLYNALSEKPLPLVPKPAEAVSEEDLLKALTDTSSVDLEKTVTYKQMKQLAADDRFLVIDARSPEDYAKGKIGDAMNIFPHDEDQDAYFQKIFTLPTDKVIVIYCNGGACDLSHNVAEDLKAAQYKRIFIYAGGWEDWEKQGKGKK